MRRSDFQTVQAIKLYNDGLITLDALTEILHLSSKSPNLSE